MILRRRSLLQLASFFILSLCAASAQTATASLGGVVRDTSGAAISDTKVVLTNIQTNVEKTTTTNSSGSYDFLDLLPGSYTLEGKQEQLPDN